LLRTSIVTIDQDRVDLEEDQEAAAAPDQDVNMEVAPTQESVAPSSKVSIDAATYARMTRRIICKIQTEESGNDGVS
jgi:hypothetical protein